MSTAEFNQQLITFLDNSPTPFHCVKSMAATLENNGYQRLLESETWDLENNGHYFVTRNDSSIVAFTYGQCPVEKGFRMVGAHTDSPCLKVKPNPVVQRKNYLQLGVEVYGGALLNPWFDRDLSLAGRITGTNKSGELTSWLIDFERPIAVIPSLAIHLDGEANKGRTVNAQLHLPPVLSLSAGDFSQENFHALLKQQLLTESPNAELDKVVSYELCFYDTQGAAIIGLEQDLLASARLDNQLSCFVGLQGLLANSASEPCLLVCNDHEEVGSASAAGAQGPMLASVLERICPDPIHRQQMLERSMMISVDNAHAIHPNYLDRHDENHGPEMNKGPVIKVNANQRYASNSETEGRFRLLAQECEESVQVFVVRSDMGCGSTIGPITATELGVKTVDVGVPTLGMHSIREIAGSQDAKSLQAILKAFYESSLPPGSF